MVRPRRLAPALVFLGVLLFPAVAHAQGSDREEPATVVVDGEDRQRQAILETLDRPEVRQVARATGLDLGAARAQARHLEGAALARAASQAGAIDRRLAIDGAISSTTLIILLLITILIIVIVQD